MGFHFRRETKKTTSKTNQRAGGLRSEKILEFHYVKGSKIHLYPKARAKTNGAELLTQLDRFQRGWGNMQSTIKRAGK